MLMRTDPFRELDRVAQQVFGTAARPAAMPIDAYRKGDEFIVLFDLPGCDPASINLTVERNVLAVHAERSRPNDEDVELLIGERPIGTFSRQLFLGRDVGQRTHCRRLHRWGAAAAGAGEGAGQAAAGRHRGRWRPADIDRGQLARRRRKSLSAPACREPPERGGAVEHEPGPSTGRRPR